jgi:hypothetical protein
MTAAYELIQRYETVVSQFGVWPSFHDGEVHRIVLDRTPGESSTLPTLEIWVRGWVMGQSTGQYLRESDCVVHFRFEGVSDVKLEGFNQQNVLTALNLSMEADLLSVELEHCFEFSGVFRARKASVVGIKPSRPAPGR